MSLDTDTIEFKDFISGLGNNLIKVPDYQRDYVWKTGSEIEEFWQDLEEHFEDLKNSPEKNGLFLGNLILCNPEDSDIFQIVDGQQRITTIFILLIAFRSWLKKLREKTNKEKINRVIARIDESLVFENRDTGEVDGYRFTAASSISAIFNYISDQDWGGDFPAKIGKKAIKRQTNRIKPIYDFFLNKIDRLLVNDNDYSILNKVINHLTFIKITLSDFQEAYLFFERTNSRGKNLEVSDLLKAHLFANHPDSEEIISYWDDIAEKSNNNLTRMLKYFYISKNGHITSSKLFNGLKGLYAGNKDNKELAAIELLINLDEFSNFYNAVNKIENEESLIPIVKSLSNIGIEGKLPSSTNQDRLNRIYRAIDGLNLFGVTQAIPLIWSVLKKYYSLELEKDNKYRKTLVLFFESLENYHFINNYILDRVGNEVEKLYSNYANKFSNSTSQDHFKDNLSGLYKALREKIATKDEFVARFSEIEYTNNNKSLYYIFDRFNSVDKNYKKISKSDRVKVYYAHLPYQKTDVTIEHWYSKSQAKIKSKTQDTPSWCNNIGNLIALDKNVNSSLGSKKPQEKYDLLQSKGEYNKFNQNRFFFEEQVSKYGSFENWGEERIKERANGLAIEAYTKIWEFNPPVIK